MKTTSKILKIINILFFDPYAYIPYSTMESNPNADSYSL